jgi:hypothetical protein
METIHEESSVDSIDFPVPSSRPGGGANKPPTPSTPPTGNLPVATLIGGVDGDDPAPSKTTKDKDGKTSKTSKSAASDGESAMETVASRKKKLKEKAKKEKDEKKKEQLEANPRELTKLTISSISVTDVVAAHRFAKNSLWIKCAVAGQSWEADSNGQLNGPQADWTNLDWTFIRARNVIDRTELVVTIGSKEVVIGKYILAPEEFDSIPDSAYFEISGRIKSSLGKVGHINIVCRRIEAERPKRAVPSELEDIVLPTTVILPQQDRVYVKLLRITLTELNAVHVVDRNSPYCRVNCGLNWEKSTSVLVRAGANAMWDRLTWKVIMNAECQFIFTVNSLSVTIGQTVVTLAEIVGAAKARNASLIDLDRYISDGSGIVGQLNVRLQVDINRPPSDSMSDTPYDDVTAFNDDIEEAKRLHNTQLLEDSVAPEAIVTRNGKRPMQSQFSLPFCVHVTMAGAYDTKQQSILSQNKSLRINAAIGEKAFATTMVPKSGRSAEWTGLNWNFVVNKGSKLRVTVWTVGKVVGQVTLDEFDLLDRPPDEKGITDIMLKMYKHGNQYRGKVRLVCEFRPYIQREEFRLLRLLKPAEDDIRDPEEKLLTEPVTEPLKLASGIEFPIIATVESIQLYDLLPVHFIAPNSPQLKLRCDHNIAYTKQIRYAGQQCSWPALNWPVPMNDGSDLLISVFSGESVIGVFEYLPAHLLRLPRNGNNMVEVSGQLIRGTYFAGRIKLRLHLKPMDLETFRVAFPAGPIGQYILEGSAAVPITNMDLNNTIKKKGNNKFAVPDYDNMGKNDGEGGLAPMPVFEDVSKMVFDPQSRSFFGFNVTLDIIEVFVSELKSMHMFQPNSPFVVVMSSKWEERTKVTQRFLCCLSRQLLLIRF